MRSWRDNKRLGDTPTQTDSSLDRLGETLAKLGLGFGDVVQAHVFLAGDPAKGNLMGRLGGA